MSYKLFIDDERYPVDDSFVIVRSSKQAIDHVKDHGFPSFISFDHDLGGIDTSIVFIRFLVDKLIDNELSIPDDFDFYVHSQNPVGKKNIENWMVSILKEFRG